MCFYSIACRKVTKPSLASKQHHTDNGPCLWVRKSHSFSFNCRSGGMILFREPLFSLFSLNVRFTNTAVSLADGEDAEQRAPAQKMTISSSAVTTWLPIPSLRAFYRTLQMCRRREQDKPTPICCLQLIKTTLFLKTQRDFFSQRMRENFLHQLFPIFLGGSISKIVMNKWMIWNNYSGVMLVSICHSKI